MNNSITLDSVISQSGSSIASNIDGDVVLLRTDTASYYNLGDIGGEIWTSLKGETSVRTVVEALLADYKVEFAECESRVVAFLEDLHREGLIAVS